MKGLIIIVFYPILQVLITNTHDQRRVRFLVILRRQLLLSRQRYQRSVKVLIDYRKAMHKVREYQGHPSQVWSEMI